MKKESDLRIVANYMGLIIASPRAYIININGDEDNDLTFSEDCKFWSKDKRVKESIIDNFLQFDTSWDWLKSVIDKIINSIGVKTIDECSEEEWFQYTRISRMYIGIEIKYAFHYVVEYIKWFNKNKK